jgi:diguanylate cyclase (GGDEF)-like protein
MAVFLLIAGLGVALGLGFRITVLLFASAVTLIAVFTLSKLTGAGMAGATFDALTGVFGLQVGYFAGTIASNLATGASQQSGSATVEAYDTATPLALTARTTSPAPDLVGPQEPVTGSRLDDQLGELVRPALGFKMALRGPNHVVESFNDLSRDLIGDRQIVGRPIREALPELAGQGCLELIDDAYRSGEARKGVHLPVRVQRIPGVPADPRLLDVVCIPIRDAGGRVSGVFLDGQDVTEEARAGERLRAAERLSRSTLDALAEHIAVVESDGTIAIVNKAWRDFGVAIGTASPVAREGSNYLTACDEAAARGDRDAARVAVLTRQVIAGEARQEQWEYESEGPAGRRWFTLRVNRFAGEGPVRVIVAREDVTERKANESRIQYLATHDALTGLPNRNLLEDRTQQSIERLRRSGQGLAVISVDLDNFRQLNDAYGHSVGDATIAACALRIAVAAEGVSDTVARLGSDEFVVVVGDAPDPGTAAARMARAIHDAINAPMSVLDDHEFTLLASVGISLYPSDGTTFDALLKNAEAAMYRAKALGRGGYQFYSPEMSARANERVIFEGELHRALLREQFELHFQPQIEIATGELVGVEALVRWQHPELGWLQPARFIPIAEETGLIGPLGRYVLREACLQNRLWRDQGMPTVPVAVNISAAQLRHADFLAMVRGIIAETGIDPKTLELEITEGTMMEVTEPLLARIDSLKQLGVRLSIDDFGTGYSNLAYLRTFPLDRLKIDQSFIASAPHDEGSQSIVRAILGLGESLGLEVVAEGVETPEQAALLEELGCRYAQGYLYGRPMPANELVAWAERPYGSGRRQAGSPMRLV